MTHVNTIHRTPLGTTDPSLLDASGSRSCPRVVRRRPPRRSKVSSITNVRAPPAATKVRTHHASRRRPHAKAAH
jgi:hypothetical protein